MQLFSCSAENVIASTALHDADNGFGEIVHAIFDDAIVRNFCFESS